jgi:DNA-binding response OmpR family regulator
MNDWYTSPPKILIAEDDLDLLTLVSYTLRNAGYEITAVTNGEDAIAAVAHERYSLLVLDINMPSQNGLQVCVTARQRSNVPVLMLSARDREQDLLQALEAGADAYLVKPFSPRILIARVQALMRRATPSESNALSSECFRLDLNELQLTYPGGALRLTKLETRVLRLLMCNPGKMVTANELVAEVWSTYSAANRNMLKQVVFRLRRKLAVNSEAFESLRTMPGGYMWSEVAASGCESAIAAAVTAASA